MEFIRKFFRRSKWAKESTIKRMFFERAEIFTSQTELILKTMPGVIGAISDLLDDKESFKGGGKFDWHEVSLVNADSEQPLMILVGILRFPVGSEVELQTGEKTIVTADTAQYFLPRIARVAIPLKLAHSLKEEVLEYLKTTEAEQKSDAEDMKKTLKEVLGITATDENQAPTKVAEKQDGIATEEGFDISQLTEQQRHQLAMSQKMGKG